MTKSKSVFGGAISLTVAALIVKIIGVAYKIPMSYILGDEGMGYFNAAYTVYGLFYIITSAGIPKAIAIATADNEKSNISYSVYKSLVFIFAIFGFILTVLLIIFALPLSNLVGSNKSYITLLSIAPSVLFVTIAGVSRGYLNGKLKLFPIAISQVIEAVSKLLFGILFALLGINLRLSLPIISALSILGITIGSLGSMLYLLIMTKNLEKEENLGQKCSVSVNSNLKQILKIAFPITLSSAILSISGVFDLSFLMRGLSDLGFNEETAISLYGNYTTLAVPMITLISSLLAPLTVSVLPRLVENNKKQGEWLGIANLSFILTLAISLPCALCFLLYSFDILDILYAVFPSAQGAEYLSLLSLGAVFLPLLNLVNTFLESRGCVTQTLISLVFGIFAKLATSIAFLIYGSFDLYALPITTVISYIVSFVISLVFIQKSAGFKIPIIALYIIICGSISFAVPYLLLYSQRVICNSFISAIVAIGVSIVLYLIFIFIAIKSRFFNDFNYQNAQKTNNLII